MRLWTLHPRYLDAKGLVALWREALLARAVLTGCTRGYRRHPQLARFRTASDPLAAINAYLAGVADEARLRGYDFDRRKIRGRRTHPPIPETRGQLLTEWDDLLRTLKDRSPDLARLWEAIPQPGAHGLFRVVDGPVRTWERAPERARGPDYRKEII
ncbi:MAG: pyrimidine dimer DNA glycosylase/endonuclease V [Nitrospirota bacterium]